MWKATNDLGHPFKIERQIAFENGRTSRAVTNGKIKTTASSNVAQNTFINDGIKAWYQTSNKLKICQTLGSVKTEVKKLVESLPI